MAITLKQRYQKEFNPKSGVFGTQFTKNTYSKDISGGGFSGQPFIKRPIPSLDDEPIGQYYSLSTQESPKKSKVDEFDDMFEEKIDDLPF